MSKLWDNIKVNDLCLKLSRITVFFLVSFYWCTGAMASTIPNTPAVGNIDVLVIDASTGEPLISATIFTEDFSFSTTTDIDGKAVIIGLENRDEVKVSYVGYSTLKIPIYEIRRQKGIIELFPDATADTIVIVGRRDEGVEDMIQVVAPIKRADIEFVNAQTAADALTQTGGVFIQKTQMGGGSPVIRGFEANRVLLVVDGVRMNNAIYRNGHHQNAITIDNSMLKQIEVIFGPGSMMYGSDALGGVVHYRTIEPKLIYGDTKKESRVTGNYSGRFSSANLEKRAHFDFMYSKRKWGFIFSGTLVDYDAMRAGAIRPEEYPDFGKRFYYPVRVGNRDQIIENLDPNIQIGIGGSSDIYRFLNTGYSQGDILLKTKYQPKEHITFILDYQFSASTNVSRYDNLTESLDSESNLKWSEWYYGPQVRSMVSLKTRILKDYKLFNKATIIGSFQRIDEDRINRKFANRFRNVNKEDVNVYALTVDFEKGLGESGRTQLSYGIDLGANAVNSIARKIDINTKELLQGDATRYPSGSSSMLTGGAYVGTRWKSQDSTIVANAGLRYSSVSLNASYLESDNIIWPEEFYTGIQNNNGSLTGAVGAMYTKKGFQVKAHIASAFRSPNIDDWAKIRAKQGKITVPNLLLKPERALTYEMTIAKEFGNYNNISKRGTSVKLSATGFYTNLKDAIVRVDSSTLEGFTTLEVDGDVFDIQTNINTDAANLLGVSLNALVKLNESWQFKSGINFTQGTTTFSNEFVQDTIVPFAHIPPMYGSTAITWQRGRIKAELSLNYNGAKLVEDYAISDIEADGTVDREGTSDNLELTASKLDDNGNTVYAGALSWTTLNLYTSFQLSERFSCNLALENITDLHYRPFASGVSAPGRNFVISLLGKF